MLPSCCPAGRNKKKKKETEREKGKSIIYNGMPLSATIALDVCRAPEIKRWRRRANIDRYITTISI